MATPNPDDKPADLATTPETSSIRIMSEKGREQYESQRKVKEKEYIDFWGSIEDTIVKVNDTDQTDLKEIKKTISMIEDYSQKLTMLSENYEQFLKSAKTEESYDTLRQHEQYQKKCSKILENTITNLKHRRLDTLETISQCGSSASTIKRKIELSKQKLEFKKREAALVLQEAVLQEEVNKTIATAERKKAQIKVELDMVKLEREHAENEMLEEVQSEVDRQEFTRDYVENHNIYNMNTLNPNAESFVPLNTVPSDTVNTMSKFLLTKEIELSRLTKFQETAETYAAWKASFQSVITELDIKPQAELDLLIKHLGTESSKYAVSIRSYNAHDPEKGKNEIWSRLDEQYGRPEMVETALKRKLDQISKITYKDPTKLYNLLDVLCEIESLKSSPQYSNMLSYFDSSTGVTPIVNKLPYGLQEKWCFRAAKYKADHRVAYPPFSFLFFFVTFIREVALTKNDPAFVFENTMREKNHQVFTKKQSVAQDHKRTDTMKRCPLHHAEHSINDCRGFRTNLLKIERSY